MNLPHFVLAKGYISGKEVTRNKIDSCNDYCKASNISFLKCIEIKSRFADGSDGKESVCNAGDWVLSLSQKDPLEKRLATHSHVLAWRIPRTDEPGRLQSTGPQRLRHDSATNTFHTLPD